MGVRDDDGGTAGGIEGGGRGTEGGSINGIASREAGSRTAIGVGDDDEATTGGVEAEGRDGVVSREVAEAPRETASMAQRRGRQWRRGQKTWVA
jgi:hypothetical protein